MTFKKLILIILFTFIGSNVHATDVANGIDMDVILQGISAVETGDSYWKVGMAGERSKYQMLSSVWKQYSTVPFWKASTNEGQYEAHRVAICHIKSILSDIQHDNYEVTAHNIALRWNGGINKVKFTRKNILYANRVSNIYNDSCSSKLDRVVEIPPRFFISTDDSPRIMVEHRSRYIISNIDESSVFVPVIKNI